MTKIAIVHERWTEISGSENVVEQLALEWPGAKIHVPFADPASVGPSLTGRLSVGPLDPVHRAIRRRSHAPMLPAVPWSMRRLDFGDVDAVVVSHHTMALSAIHAAKVPTVAYVHSPARWAWDAASRRGEASSALGRFAIAGLARHVIHTELSAARQITQIVAGSTEVSNRIQRWWGRESTVVFPPVDIERFVLGEDEDRGDFFLFAGRLVGFKRVDIALRAARKAGVKLVVIGDGRYASAYRSMAGPEAEFLGWLSPDQMLPWYQRAKAVLIPGVEDFGIVPVEAMACGTPVIALAAAGPLDTVLPGISGQLVEPTDDNDALVSRFAAALRDFRSEDYDPARIRRHAEGFSNARFRERMRAVVDGL